MRRLTIITLIFLVLTGAGCSGEKKAAELLETARFEEKQNNREHAVKLYEEITRAYPNSPAAREAAARLEELRRPSR
ncbi:MAG: hypothetical protein HYV06_04070 [Deltaproteobacteria bacterium]|nr:hypothetical protein [Deltaproteobacteria bacterium]